MALDNPAFSRNKAFASEAKTTTATAAPSAEALQQLYESPAASSHDTGRMTVEDTIVKTAISFVLLVAGGAVGWAFPALWVPAALVGFALALVNIFKKKPSAPLVLLYAAIEGVFVGAVSGVFEAKWEGIVVQAVLATVAVIAVTLALFASGKIRASARATKVFLIAMVGYLVFSVINLVLMWTGANTNPFGLRGSVEIFGIPLGLVLGVLVVIMGAYSLVLDFDYIQRGVANRAPREYGWSGAFGIMVTVVWLYLEILRMFAIARN
ncbi:Bax inhibitor-1/YccA family protein [Diaminobutyricibacter sp. McL0608]|uniref:Bax inhibitor-1/YccA family protein n=1 Tax=Leifsonia sp. McL0608 TaxID=3143537 RepID=UPI0031F31840